MVEVASRRAIVANHLTLWFIRVSRQQVRVRRQHAHRTSIKPGLAIALRGSAHSRTGA
jgi:hypothetical protein